MFYCVYQVEVWNDDKLTENKKESHKGSFSIIPLAIAFSHETLQEFSLLDIGKFMSVDLCEVVDNIVETWEFS